MRLGIILAVIIGGIISISILLVGTMIEGDFSFEALATTLRDNLGPWAGRFFAIGLFAAGLSSAITAPLAAAVTGCQSYWEKAITGKQMGNIFAGYGYVF